MTPFLNLTLVPSGPGRYKAMFEGLEVANSDQPVVDGARRLIKEGYPGETLMTARHEGSQFDSFEPLPLDTWAKWTYSEGKQGLHAVRYTPFTEGPLLVFGKGKSGG